MVIIIISWWPHITSHDCNDPHYQDHHHTLTSLHLHKARPPLPRAAVEDRGRSWHCRTANYQTSATVGLDSIVDIPSSTSSLSLLSLALSLLSQLWSLFLLSSSSPRKRSRHLTRQEIKLPWKGQGTPLSQQRISRRQLDACSTFSEWGDQPQFLKLNLVPHPQILGPFGFPEQRINFNICNKRQKWAFCDNVNFTLIFPLRNISLKQ